MNVELTSILNLDKINISGMIDPKPETMKYYEDYYLAEGRFANDVIVDEQWNLRAGYVTYLLAKKYGVRPPIFEVRASSPLIKVVVGRYVSCGNQKQGQAARKREAWIYALKESVVPGDILCVETRGGAADIEVETVKRIADDGSYGDMRKALKHVGKRKNILESET